MKRKEYPSKEYLDECFVYNPITGILTWKERPTHHFDSDKICNNWNSRYSNTVAGTINKDVRRPDSKGYLMININHSRFNAHLIIWIMTYGSLPNNPIDHTDENSLNNRIQNLVERTVNVNLRKRSYKTNKSGYKGVSSDKNGKWVSQISINGKVIYIGSYEDIEYAAKIYSTAAFILNGENFTNIEPFNNETDEYKFVENKINSKRFHND